MSDFAHRIADALLRSELLPVGARMRAMRLAGYDVAPSSCLWAGAVLRSKKLSIGENVFINVGFFHDGFEILRIGGNVRIGQYVRIITATHEIGLSRQRCLVEVVGKPVEIGQGSWIGCGVIILPGVTIAPGCVIAAGAVVTKSTEPDGLYAGSPARLIRKLPINSQELPLNEAAE
jgi:maltose O-acetyltransferase